MKKEFVYLGILAVLMLALPAVGAIAGFVGSLLSLSKRPKS